MGSPSTFRYQPALDGLRALCVLSIMLYHADLPWLPGGFLGVEVFFVISGYLITSLLRVEFAQTARIDLVAFWSRRARRLLPALWGVLLCVSLVAVAFLPDEIWRLRGEVVAGLTYVSNWYLLFSHQSYFEQVGRPSLLRHLWSLAIEEQFYLVWPLVFAWLARKAQLRTVGYACLLLAAASGLWMALRVVPGEDPSPLYFDSAARAAAMLLGAALACLRNPADASGETSSLLGGYAIDLAGTVALLALLFACTSMGEADASVFQGGLLLVDGCALVAIVALVHPRGVLLKRILGTAPLRYVGTRSYGLYLWHWPLFALTRPGLDVPLEGSANLALRFAAALVLSELSFRLIEEPVRSGRFMTSLYGAWKSKGDGTDWQVLRPMLLLGFGCLIGGLFVTHGFVKARPPQEPNWEMTMPGPGKQTDLTTGHPSLAASRSVLARAEQVTKMPTRTATDATVNASPHVLVFGDSVVLGAKNYLRAGHEREVEFDSEIGRTSSTALPRLRKLKRQHKLPKVVIMHLGNNGWLYEEQVHEIMSLLEGVERVVFINARVAKRWRDRNNSTLATALSQHPRAILVDWSKESEGHRDWVGADGLHLTPKGAQAFADLISPYYALSP